MKEHYFFACRKGLILSGDPEISQREAVEGLEGMGFDWVPVVLAVLDEG
jgi:hypothetical protein